MLGGLLKDRLTKGRERLEDALEAVRALCEPVEAPKDDQAYYRYFSSKDPGNAERLKANDPQRLSLYKLTATLVRAYANLASEMMEAGCSLELAKTAGMMRMYSRGVCGGKAFRYAVLKDEILSALRYGHHLENSR